MNKIIMDTFTFRLFCDALPSSHCFLGDAVLLDSFLTNALGNCRHQLPLLKRLGSTTTAATTTANPTLRTSTFSLLLGTPPILPLLTKASGRPEPEKVEHLSRKMQKFL